MFHLSKSEVLPLTPELARQFKEMEPSPTERDLNPARLKMLRDKADKGLLIPFNWSTAVLGERRLRINGQRVEGEAAWRALLGDPQTDIRAVEEALANFRCLLEVRRAALP